MPVSYTHLDVYKRQLKGVVYWSDPKTKVFLGIFFRMYGRILFENLVTYLLTLSVPTGTFFFLYFIQKWPFIEDAEHVSVPVIFRT